MKTLPQHYFAPHSLSRWSTSGPNLCRTLSCLAFGSLALGCQGDAVDLGGNTVSRDLARGTRCLDATRVEENVVVNNQQELDALAGCEEVAGNLIVRLFPAADLTPLSALRVVEGQFALGVQASWDQIFGFQISDQFDTERDLVEAGWLESLEGVQSLERVGALFLRGLPDEDLTAFTSLESVGSASLGLDLSGVLILQQNRELRSLRGLENVRDVQTLIVTLSPEIESLSGLSPSDRLRGVSLYTSPRSSDLSALAGVSSLDALTIYQSGVTDLSGLSGLESVVALSLTENPLLADASGLATLSGAERISITGNPVLGRLPSFSNFTTQPDTIVIRDNPALASVSLDFDNATTPTYAIVGFLGQPGAVSVELGIDVIDIQNNQSLESLSISAGLTLANLVVVGGNAALRSVDFGSLRELGQLSVVDNPALDGVDVGALESVSRLEVARNPRLSTAAFEGLQTLTQTLEGNAD